MLKPAIQCLCFSLMLTAVTSRANGEPNLAKRMYVGGQAGLTLARIGGPDANNDSAREHYHPSFGLSGLVGTHLHGRYRAQAELGFVARVSKTTVDGEAFATNHLNYLEMPILARMELPINQRVGSYVLTGPSLGFLLSANIDMVNGGNIDVAERLNRVDIGWVLGVGAIVPLAKRGAMTFDARYTHGLRNLNRPMGSEKVMNRTVYFMVGYQTDLGFLSGAAPAASKASQPVAEPPANNNESAPPDTKPVANEPEVGIKAKPAIEPENAPSPE